MLVASTSAKSQNILFSADDFFVDHDSATIVVPITLTTSGAIDVTALTFDLIYDSDVLTPTACNDFLDIAFCNPNFVDTLKFTGLNINSGIPNGSVVVNFVFSIDPNSFDFSPLQIDIIDIFDTASADVTSLGTVSNGSVTVFCEQSIIFALGGDFISGSSGIYNASTQITAYNKVLVGADIEFKAGQYILLDNNFEIEMSANFLADIENCAVGN